jgi:hypothetical protein
MRDFVDRLRRKLPGAVPGPTEPPADPFRTFELQARLTRLAGELDQLDRGSTRQFARRHHSRAALLAYDQTLDEACELIGQPVTEPDESQHRLLAEATLLQAGWTW